jgi:hypothetical protein
LPALFQAYRDQIFGARPADAGTTVSASQQQDLGATGAAEAGTLPAIQLNRLVWGLLIAGDWEGLSSGYVFDTHPLSDNRPYFSGYIRVLELPSMLGRLELLQDEWGYILLWVTFVVAAAGSLLLIALPIMFCWRTLFLPTPGKFRIFLYFAGLGLGYITIEVAFLSKFALVLSNTTIAAGAVITGMLVCSGIGSVLSRCCISRANIVLPALLLCIGIGLVAYASFIDSVLVWTAPASLTIRIALCLAFLLPVAVLMGFPMPIAMTMLAHLGREHMFVWAWGINGCFSVVGAALVPIIGTAIGLNEAIIVGACAYWVAMSASSAVLPRASEMSIGTPLPTASS